MSELDGIVHMQLPSGLRVGSHEKEVRRWVKYSTDYVTWFEYFNYNWNLYIRCGRMRGDARNLWKRSLHQYRRRSDLWMSCWIQTKRQTKFDAVHRCQRRTLLRSVYKTRCTMFFSSNRRHDEKTLLLHYGKSVGEILRRVSSRRQR